MSFLNCGFRTSSMIGIMSLLAWAGSALPGSALPTLAAPVLLESQLVAQVTPTADSAMTPVNGKVNIRFVNETGAEIEYQVVGDTEYRSLAGKTELVLRDLPVATTLTFRRKDSGLLRVQFRADEPTGTITVNVGATTDFALDRTTLYIDQQGKIFFN